MFGINGLELVHVLQFAYMLIGLGVAYWHIERNQMKESLRSVPIGFKHVGNLAWYFLALMWPVLLFAYFVEPKRKPKRQDDDQRKTDSSTAS